MKIETDSNEFVVFLHHNAVAKANGRYVFMPYFDILGL